MKNDQGTPKSLDEAITQGICIGPMREVRQRLHDSIIDYAAQKFAIAYLQMGAWRDGSSTTLTPEEILEQLFENITGRKK